MLSIDLNDSFSLEYEMDGCDSKSSVLQELSPTFDGRTLEKNHLKMPVLYT